MRKRKEFGCEGYIEKEKGEYHLLIREMKLYDHMLFYQQFRMIPEKY